MATVFHPEEMELTFEEAPVPEYSWHTSPRLAQLVGSKHMIFDIRSLDAGNYSCPYHFHRNAEELFVIQSGSATLRTPKGLHILKQGDIVFFEMGEDGAHQLFNHTDIPCVYLDLRTVVGLDVCIYPDSGKINIWPYNEIFESKDQVDYFCGEDHIKEKWATLTEGK